LPKTSFLNIAKRITGVSVPIFGLQWQPPTFDADVAHGAVTFLEDRRALFYPFGAEEVDHVVKSILDIRAKLTNLLETLDRTSELATSLVAMRAACRRFMDRTTIGITIPTGNLTGQPIYGGALMYFHALSELRATFGFHLALICVKYGVDVEEGLASIIPAVDSNGSDAWPSKPEA
jgi:hypothetical protein